MNTETDVEDHEVITQQQLASMRGGGGMCRPCLTKVSPRSKWLNEHLPASPECAAIRATGIRLGQLYGYKARKAYADAHVGTVNFRGSY